MKIHLAVHVVDSGADWLFTPAPPAFPPPAQTERSKIGLKRNKKNLNSTGHSPLNRP